MKPTFGESWYLGNISTAVWVDNQNDGGGHLPPKPGVLTVNFYREMSTENLYFVLTHPALSDQVRRPLPDVDGSDLVKLIFTWEEVVTRYELDFQRMELTGEGKYHFLEFRTVFRRLGLDDKSKCLEPLLMVLASLPVPPWHVPYMVF